MPEDWPPEGLALAAAIERLLDQAELDREASQLLATVVDVRSALAGGGGPELIAAGQGARAAVAAERFKPIMMEGRYRAQGRRGSPAAPLSEIPSSAWPYLDIDANASQIIERVAGGVIWYDVRILAPPPVSESAAIAEMSKSFRSAKDCRDWAFANILQKRDETSKAYLDHIAEFCAQAGFPQNSLRQRWSDYRKRPREQK
jgi:hypothetical protein